MATRKRKTEILRQSGDEKQLEQQMLQAEAQELESVSLEAVQPEAIQPEAPQSEATEPETVESEAVEPEAVEVLSPVELPRPSKRKRVNKGLTVAVISTLEGLAEGETLRPSEVYTKLKDQFSGLTLPLLSVVMNYLAKRGGTATRDAQSLSLEP